MQLKFENQISLIREIDQSEPGRYIKLCVYINPLGYALEDRRILGLLTRKTLFLPD